MMDLLPQLCRGMDVSDATEILESADQITAARAVR